jgi:AbrB family looped-hinge helix DNA binding protein
MTLVKVKAAQITLPSKVREALEIDDDDYLEIELVEGGALLRRATVDRVAIREAAWRRIEEAMASVNPTPEQAAKPIEEQEAEILVEVKEVRRALAAERRRR